MSPSIAAKCPYFWSSSASRSRCMTIWRAVAAAIRPKSVGVSSYSPTASPSSFSSGAKTWTAPDLRSIVTRPPLTWFSVFSYALSRASSSASMTTEMGMSLSASSCRSAAMSMSMSLLVCDVVELNVSGPVELHLHCGALHVAERDHDLRAVHGERDIGVGRGSDPSGEPAAIGEGHEHQPAGVAPPVGGLDQRSPHPARAHLEDVRLRAGQLGLVERVRHSPGRVGHFVEQRTLALRTVTVDTDPQHRA